MPTLVKFILSLPIATQILLVVCVFFILTSGFFLTYLLFRKIKMLRHEVTELLLQQQIDQILTEQIIKCNDQSPNNKSTGLLTCVMKLKEFPYQQEWVRNAIIKRIIYNKQTFSGDINDQLTRLYLQMGFQNSSINNVKSRNRKVRLHAINELYLADVRVEESLIHPLLRHNDPLTRKYARCLLIKNEPAASFNFLDDVEDELLPWEQYELHSILAPRNFHDIPLFAQWIRSDLNPTIASFSIKMAVHFKQDDAIPLLVKLLDEATPELRQEAAIALAKLKEIKATAKHSFGKHTNPAMEQLRNLPDGNDGDIEKLIQQTYNPIIKN